MRSAAEYGEAPAVGRAPLQTQPPRAAAAARSAADVAERARAREAALEAKLRARLVAFVADSGAAEVGRCRLVDRVYDSICIQPVAILVSGH